MRIIYIFTRATGHVSFTHTRMKKPVLLIVISLICSCNYIFCQHSNAYYILVSEAYKLYESKDYLNSGLKYAEAFKADGNKGYLNDRYNAACSWSLANRPDSSFAQLYIIARKGKFTDYDHLLADTDLANLYADERWKEIKEIVLANKAKAEVNFDRRLIALLDTIFNDDQKYRLQITAVGEKYGWTTGAADSIALILKHVIRYTDSINQVKLTGILDKYGWLGPDVVGELGNSTFFAVIQHSDLAVQEKYLPFMREAVKNGNARADQLALLIDRVALRQGRKQIYGSQFGQDPETKMVYVSPLEDPDNVDVRRAEVGLPPLQEYIDMYNLNWDPEQYKKDLPKYEAIEKTELLTEDYPSILDGDGNAYYKLAKKLDNTTILL